MYNLILKISKFLALSMVLLINLNIAYAQSKFSKSGKPQDEAFCKMQAPETRGFHDKCINEKNEFIGYEYQITIDFEVAEDYKKILDQYKSAEYLEELEKSNVCTKKGAKKGDRNRQCAESLKIQTKNIELLAKNCMDNSKSLIKAVVDNKISAQMNPIFFTSEKDRGPDAKLGCNAVLTFQDKDIMCSVSNKLLDHVTKENLTIYPDTFILLSKRSIGSEVKSYPTKTENIAMNRKFLENSEYCKKEIDGFIAKAQGK